MTLLIHTIHKGKFFSFIKLFCLSLLYITSFSIKAQEWQEEISSDGSLPIHRFECNYIEVDGKFYLLGGRKAGVEKYVNIYDPIAKKWTKGATTNIEIHHFQPVLYNHKIYIVSAFTGNFPNETPVPNIYIYDPSADTWTVGPEIPQDRQRGSAGVVLYNNKIYVAGGIVHGHTGGFVKWFDEYDLATNTWTQLNDAPIERDHFQAGVINNKLILAAGRQTSTANGSNAVIKQIDVYDFASQTWTTMKSVIPTPRAGVAVVVVGSELFVMGGEGPNAPNGLAHRETEAYNLSNDSWRSVALLITGRHATGALLFDGNIFIVAGSSTPGGNSASELSSQERLKVSDSNINTATLAPMNNSIKIYPNPFTDQINIDLSALNQGTEIKIYDAFGKLCKSYSLAPNTLQINGSDLNQGVYLIQFFQQGGNLIQSLKLIKK